MANQYRIGKHATSAKQTGDILRVRYHSTDVVTVNRISGNVILNTGGWKTVTTKTRMNQTANQFALGFYVFQKDRKWFVRLDNGNVLPFEGSKLEFNYKE
jgi:hypothetical protein